MYAKHALESGDSGAPAYRTENFNMRIEFECSGGFANLQLKYHINTDTLPQEQAVELLKLVEDSGFFDLQQSDIAPTASGGSPDMFSYRLSLSEGIRQTTLTFNDVTAPNSLHPLLGVLRKLAIEQKQKGI